MQNYQAVILAAGMGVRLGKVAQEVPKGLVEIGEMSLVARSVQNLRAFGIQDIILVTGYQADMYADFAKDKPYITLVHNNRYSASGNMYSFSLTRSLLHKDILLLESDIIYEKRALEWMGQSTGRDGVLLSGYTGAGDEVYVSAKDGCVTGISKNRDTLGTVVGEWVGISKVSQSLQAEMFKWAESRFKTSLLGDYESDCLADVVHHYDIGFEKVEDLAWAEMDDAHHYERMKADVLPLVVTRDAHYFSSQKVTDG